MYIVPFLIAYASNEPKSVLARDLGDCRDNLRNSRSVFLIVGKENKEPMGQNLSFRKNNRRKKKKKPQMKKKNHLKFTNRSKKLKFRKEELSYNKEFFDSCRRDTMCLSGGSTFDCIFRASCKQCRRCHESDN